MSLKIRTSDLFYSIPPLLRPIFNGESPPWIALTLLKDAIEEIIKSNHLGLIEYSHGVLIGKDVEIEDGATLLPPTVILSGAKIRQGAYIRGSVFVGEGATVGHATEIKNSILMDGAQAPHFNYVGDSILGSRAHIGAGVILSNLKSDRTPVTIHGISEIRTDMRKLGAIIGDGAEVGCGSVLNPGTVIGRGSRVYPLTSFRGVLPENCIAKSQKDIIKMT